MQLSGSPWKSKVKTNATLIITNLDEEKSKFDYLQKGCQHQRQNPKAVADKREGKQLAIQADRPSEAAGRFGLLKLALKYTS